MRMANPFSRTLRSLDGERSTASLLLPGALLVLLLLWAVWFFQAELPVFVTSETARLEAARAVHPVTARGGGKLLRVAVAVGQEVAAGDVLFELEAEAGSRRVEEERARLVSLARQLASRRAGRESEAAGLAAARRAGDLTLREAAERRRSAESAAAQATDEAGRRERLHAQGLVPESELVRARTEAERRRAEAAELRLALDRLGEDRAREESDRRTGLGEADREIAELAGDVAAQEAVVRRLEEEEAWRLIRAPVAGRVGELARLDAGAVVQPGERLGTLVPGAGLKVLGGFAPAAALGRVRPGQAAEVRLDAFPWTEFGALPARVAGVSGELREGRVWVDLSLEPGADGRVPLQHGLPGTVLVETERLSPASLLLRTLGLKLQGWAGRGEAAGG